MEKTYKYYVFKVILYIPVLIILIFFPKIILYSEDHALAIFLSILIGIDFLICIFKTKNILTVYFRKKDSEYNSIVRKCLFNIFLTITYFLFLILGLTTPREIKISKISDFKYMYGEKCTFVLTNDIDFKNKSIDGFQVKGIFDGNGYTLKNLNLKSNLFSCGDNTVIKNLNIDNVTVLDNKYKTFGILCQFNWSTLDNIHITNANINIASKGGTIYENISVGGLVGTNYGIIRNSSYQGNINVVSSNILNAGVGGIAGVVSENGVVEKCSFSGNIKTDITAKSNNSRIYAGGIVGEIQNNNIISNCYSEGEIENDTSKHYVNFNFVGGIASGNQNNILNCYSTCKVTGYALNCTFLRVSGIAASAVSSAAKNCVFMGSLNIKNASEGKGDKKSFNIGTHAEINCYYIELEKIQNNEIDTKTWFKNTLGLSEEIWDFFDNQLPRLKGGH